MRECYRQPAGPSRNGLPNTRNHGLLAGFGGPWGPSPCLVGPHHALPLLERAESQHGRPQIPPKSGWGVKPKTADSWQAPPSPRRARSVSGSYVARRVPAGGPAPKASWPSALFHEKVGDRRGFPALRSEGGHSFIPSFIQLPQSPPCRRNVLGRTEDTHSRPRGGTTAKEAALGREGPSRTSSQVPLLPAPRGRGRGQRRGRGHRLRPPAGRAVGIPQAQGGPGHRDPGRAAGVAARRTCPGPVVSRSRAGPPSTGVAL